jgi:secreted PhoX family phosphatase
VYCTLTNNNRRGRQDHPNVDAANPRGNNTMGHIIQWTEDGDFDLTTFRWKHLLLAGNPANERPEARGNIRGDVFACPDGLTLDARGVLWIQTDISSDEKHRGEMQGFGNNQMLACDPAHPTRYSNWPDFKPGGRPRSATVAIRKADGGPIGT